MTKRILEEDDYVASLEHIIERDFFPNAEGHRAELARLEGTAAGLLEQEERGRGREASSLLNLEQFLAQYTSEDNAAFEQLQNEDIKKHREKFHWVYPMNSSSGSSSSSSSGDQDDNDKARYREGMLMLYYLKNGQTKLNAAERAKMDEYVALANGRNSTHQHGGQGGSEHNRKFTVRNSFFYPPEESLQKSIRTAQTSTMLIENGRPPVPQFHTQTQLLLKNTGHGEEGDRDIDCEEYCNPDVNVSSAVALASRNQSQSQNKRFRPGSDGDRGVVRDTQKRVVPANTAFNFLNQGLLSQQGMHINRFSSMRSPLEAPHSPSLYSTSSGGVGHVQDQGVGRGSKSNRFGIGSKGNKGGNADVDTDGGYGDGDGDGEREVRTGAYPGGYDLVNMSPTPLPPSTSRNRDGSDRPPTPERDLSSLSNLSNHIIGNQENQTREAQAHHMLAKKQWQRKQVQQEKRKLQTTSGSASTSRSKAKLGGARARGGGFTNSLTPAAQALASRLQVSLSFRDISYRGGL